MTTMPDVAERLIEQCGDVLVEQRVDAVASNPFRHHQLVLAQHPKLMRDRGLFHLQSVHELADGVGAVEKAREDPHPAGSRQREHGVGDLLGDPLVNAQRAPAPRAAHRRAATEATCMKSIVTGSGVARASSRDSPGDTGISDVVSGQPGENGIALAFAVVNSTGLHA
jgi:hypothetical protein